MAARYVPPALRGKAVANENTSSDKPEESNKPSSSCKRVTGSSSDSSETLYTVDEIHAHFWPESAQDGSDQDPERPKSGRVSNAGTLNGTAAVPGELGYVILFAGANPRWKDDGIIYAKSNLALLERFVDMEDGGVESVDLQSQDAINQDMPKKDLKQFEGQVEELNTLDEHILHSKDNEELATATPSDGKEPAPIPPPPPPPPPTPSATPAPNTTRLPSPPIPAFEQLSRTPQTGRVFRFSGWYAVSAIEMLAPHSAALVRMLHQKWSVKRRDGGVKMREREEKAWKDSLGHRWAVMQFVRDKEADEKRGKVVIERIEEETDDGVQTKGVNELLKELRMGARGEEKQASDGEGT